MEAIEVAAAAPLTQDSTAWAAKVPWITIHALRQALDDLGLDWRQVRAENEARRRTNRAGGGATT